MSTVLSESARPELQLISQHVLRAFDYALDLGRCDPRRLDYLENAASGPWEALRQPASNDDSNEVQAKRARLRALLPAALAWVARHADADPGVLQQFRLHLSQRCERIIREQPHSELPND